MGFNLYFAGADRLKVTLPAETCCGCLYTYAYKEKKLDELINNTVSKIFIDSGAFSMYHSGIDISIDEYIAYINNPKNDKVNVWAQLDVIPYPVLDTKTAKESSDGSWEKYLYAMDNLKDEKRDIFLPIYHYGEPYSHLERILNTEVHGRLAPYIGVGGRHGVSRDAHDKYYQHIFGIVKNSKNPNVKIHAFGMTVFELLERFPFYSADSTTWLMGAINGQIYTKTKGIVSISNVSKGKSRSYWNLPTPLKNKITEEILANNYTVEELAQDYNRRLAYNRAFFQDWAENYEYRPPHDSSKRRRLF